MIVDRPRAFHRPCDAEPVAESLAARLADRFDDGVAAYDSPAILRLKMLEMKIKVAGPLPDAARRSAQHLIGALKRAIAEKPAMSFADVVAKLKTSDELAADGIGEKADSLRMSMIGSAIADLRRLPPSI
jgi:hypothetical protein